MSILNYLMIYVFYPNKISGIDHFQKKKGKLLSALFKQLF